MVVLIHVGSDKKSYVKLERGAVDPLPRQLPVEWFMNFGAQDLVLSERRSSISSGVHSLCGRRAANQSMNRSLIGSLAANRVMLVESIAPGGGGGVGPGASAAPGGRSGPRWWREKYPPIFHGLHP